MTIVKKVFAIFFLLSVSYFSVVEASVDTVAAGEGEAIIDIDIIGDEPENNLVVPIDSVETKSSEIGIEVDIEVEVDKSVATDEAATDGTADEIDGGDFQLEKLPEVIEFIEAKYPPELVSEGITGSVLMNILINEEGKVDSVEVEIGLHPALDSAAVNALRQFRFSPAIFQGEPIAVVLQYEYLFTLDEFLEEIEEFVNFKGRVVEMGTRVPIADATVIVTVDPAVCKTRGLPFNLYMERIGTMGSQEFEGESIITQTDENGYFEFTSLPFCSLNVRVVATGYEPFVDAEILFENEALEVLYRIERSSYSEFEITVIGKRERKEVARRALTISEVRRVPGVGGDAVRVVQAFPGVARPTFFSGAILLRGAGAGDSRFFIDGIRIPRLYHFGGLKSVYNSEALESVSMYPGGFSTRYGAATAGVIEITGRKPRNDRWQGFVDMNLFDASFMIEGPVNERVSILASARRSYVGNIIGWAVDNLPFDFPISIAPYYWDYLLRADFNINERSDGYVTFFGARNRLDVIFSEIRGGNPDISEDTDMVRVDDMFNMVLVGNNYRISDNLTNQARVSYVDSRTNSSVFGFVSVDAFSRSFYARNQLEWKLSDILTLYPGIDLTVENPRIYLVIPSADGIFVRDTLTNSFGPAGAYLNMAIRPTPRLMLMPGYRIDWFYELNHVGNLLPEFYDEQGLMLNTRHPVEASARLTARYDLTEEHTIKGSIGNYSQTPVPVGQAISERWGNPDLSATRARHLVLGHEWQITDLIRSDIQIYDNRQWNIPRPPVEDDFAAAVDPSDIELFYDDGEGRMYGMELLLRHDQGGRFFGWIAYTLSRSERYDFEDRGWVLFDNDQTHNFQLVGSWRLPHNFDAGFRFRYTTGNPETPVIGTVFTEHRSTYRTILGPRNSGRVDPFIQLDLRFDKKLIFDRFIASAYLDVQNVLYPLYRSPEFYIYNYDRTERQPVTSFIYPSLGMRINF